MKNGHRLRGKNFRISVQVPREVEEKRKLLMPLFKEAKARKQKPHWSRDVLYVGDTKHKPAKPKVNDINVDTTLESLKLKVKRAPPKVVGDNTFQGSSVAITCSDQVIPALHAVFSDHRCARAGKTMYAYRVETATGISEYFDDDGEFGAGRRILQQLQTANKTNTLVCVTRWCGKQLGPARFNHISDVVNSILQN